MLGAAKIAQLEGQLLFLVCLKKDIRALEVAVDNVVLVQVAQAL